MRCKQEQAHMTQQSQVPLQRSVNPLFIIVTVTAQVDKYERWIGGAFSKMSTIKRAAP